MKLEMKNMNKTLCLVFFLIMGHWALYGQGETVIFLDISGLDGDYATPSSRPVVTSPGPKQKNILIESYSITKTNELNIGSSSGGVGAGKAYGTEMELNFGIDQSVIELSKRLFNKTLTPYMNLFIDTPANNGDPQRERMRIKLTNVTINSIDQSQTGAGIPTYKMKIRFVSNLTAVITYNFDYSSNTIVKYCWDYSRNSICTNDNF
jgi:type VI protein secretion system component Hcp